MEDRFKVPFKTSPLFIFLSFQWSQHSHRSKYYPYYRGWPNFSSTLSTFLKPQEGISASGLKTSLKSILVQQPLLRVLTLLGWELHPFPISQVGKSTFQPYPALLQCYRFYLNKPSPICFLRYIPSAILYPTSNPYYLSTGLPPQLLITQRHTGATLLGHES